MPAEGAEDTLAEEAVGEGAAAGAWAFGSVPGWELLAGPGGVRAAAGAVACDEERAQPHAYPRGVTIRPATTRVCELPTTTVVVMPTSSGASAASVVSSTC